MRALRTRTPAPPLTVNGWLRYDVVEGILEALPPRSTVVEIGAGMGSVGARLAARHRYTGVEPDRRSFEAARRRVARAGGGTVLLGDAASLPQTVRADAVCAFEVLEHIEDDEAALRQWRELLRPGGMLVISVPAWQRRFGPSDVKVGHYRRYDRTVLVERLRSAGFESVEIFTYGFPLGYALEAIWDVLARRRERVGSMADRSSKSGRWLQPPPWLGWLPQLTSFPFRLVQRPFVRTNLGIGFVARAHSSMDES